MSDNDTASLNVDVAQLQKISQLQKRAFDSLPMMISVFEVVSRTEFRVALMNQTALQANGAVEADVLGKQISELIGPDEAAPFEQKLQVCFDSNEPVEAETSYELPNGMYWAFTHFSPIHQDDGTITHILVVWEDITARKQREEAERQQQEAIITHQAATLAELSTPLLAISDTTVVMPLVGTVDSRRVQQIMESLLTGVADTRATNVILDITGVSVVDTQVANVFVQASQAVSLLGAQIILTGIRPEVAQTLVSLGVDLSRIITRSSLQNGIAYALKN